MILEELKAALHQGVMQFKTKVLAYEKFQNGFLNQTHWTSNGTQHTLLTYLIELDSEYLPLSEPIQWLLDRGADCYINQPLHRILQLNNQSLAFLFFDHLEQLLLSKDGNSEQLVPLEESEENLSRDSNKSLRSFYPAVLHARDQSGMTLFARAIASKESIYVNRLLKLGVDVNQASPVPFEGGVIEAQPLHQAIIDDMPEVVPALLKKGAQAFNPAGPLRETPLLLAVRLGRVELIEILCRSIAAPDTLQGQNPINYNNELLRLNEENAEGLYPIEVLCKRLSNRNHRGTQQQTLKAIAILLYHGSLAPRWPELTTDLVKHRMALVNAIQSYWKEYRHLRGYPALIIDFVRRSLNKNDPLHSIMYAQQSPQQSLMAFLGKIDERPAVKMQALFEEAHRALPDAVQLADQTKVLSTDELNFTRFIERYETAKNAHTFFKIPIYNPWSGMRQKLARGEITTWEGVVQYAHVHAKSRTSKIVIPMLEERKMPSIPMEECEPPEILVTSAVKSAT